MKILFIGLWLLLATGIQAQNTQISTETNQLTLPPSQYRITTQNANSRIWEWTTYKKSRVGDVISQKHSYMVSCRCIICNMMVLASYLLHKAKFFQILLTTLRLLLKIMVIHIGILLFL